jgi:hypothetical protein
VHVAPVGQATVFAHVEPQLVRAFRFVSQSAGLLSQLAVPAAQVVQEPSVQACVPAAHAVLFAQVVPHVARVFRFVSQSVALLSQLAVPAPQFTQAPFVQICVPAVHASASVLVTKSGPQLIWFAARQKRLPGIFPTHSATIGSHFPAVAPSLVSQLDAPGH